MLQSLEKEDKALLEGLMNILIKDGIVLDEPSDKEILKIINIVHDFTENLNFSTPTHIKNVINAFNCLNDNFEEKVCNRFLIYVLGETSAIELKNRLCSTI